MLPNNTYYNESGALINANRINHSLKQRVELLENKVEILMEELIRVNSKLAELSNKQTTSEAGQDSKASI